MIRCIICYCILAFCLPSFVLAQEVSTQAPQLEDDWLVAEPADAGLFPAALTTLVELIDIGVNYQNVCAVVIEHGPTMLHELRSFSKSVTSILLCRTDTFGPAGSRVT